MVIDEFQDTSAVQYGLLHILASHKRITIVGDEDQVKLVFSYFIQWNIFFSSCCDKFFTSFSFQVPCCSDFSISFCSPFLVLVVLMPLDLIHFGKIFLCTKRFGKLFIIACLFSPCLYELRIRFWWSPYDVYQSLFRSGLVKITGPHVALLKLHRFLYKIIRKGANQNVFSLIILLGQR